MENVRDDTIIKCMESAYYKGKLDMLRKINGCFLLRNGRLNIDTPVPFAFFRTILKDMMEFQECMRAQFEGRDNVGQQIGAESQHLGNPPRTPPPHPHLPHPHTPHPHPPPPPPPPPPRPAASLFKWTASSTAGSSQNHTTVSTAGPSQNHTTVSTAGSSQNHTTVVPREKTAMKRKMDSPKSEVPMKKLKIIVNQPNSPQEKTIALIRPSTCKATPIKTLTENQVNNMLRQPAELYVDVIVIKSEEEIKQE